MHSSHALAWVSVLLYLPWVVGQTGSDILDFVDPLIGTAKGGHVFAGATLPFGMAKAVADSIVDGQGGFATDGGKISGYANSSNLGCNTLIGRYRFSHMHDSGTGGVSCNLPLLQCVTT